jgi:hypothetical protein
MQNDEWLQQFRAHLSANFLQPTPEEVGDEQVTDFLRDNIRVVVPMHEYRPVIEPLLSTLIGVNKYNPKNLTVINDRSLEPAFEPLNKWNIKAVDRSLVLDCLDWEQLLPILSLEEIPVGKGVAVLAGYLVQWAYAEKYGAPMWLAQNDSEESYYATYRALEYITYGITQVPGCGYVKLAKSGRGNERCLSARGMLHVLAQNNFVNAAIASRAGQLFHRLIHHKWMLAGTFAMKWELAMNRPFATGYLEETVISMYCEDVFAHNKQGCTVHVNNPNDRGDGDNDERKESIMQQQISNFVLQMALSADPLNNWGLSEIARLNQECMKQSFPVAWMGSEQDLHMRNMPCQGDIVHNDRLIPSVMMLINEDFVDTDNLRRLV